MNRSQTSPDPQFRQTHTSAPLTRTALGLLRVSTNVDGRAATFLVDTGASGTVLGLSFANQLGIAKGPAEDRVIGCTLSEDATLADVHLSIESVDVGKRRVAVVDLSQVNEQLEQAGAESIDGLVGADVLAATEALIEYSHPQLWLRA